MTLSLRAKLLAIVSTAIAGFVVLFVTNLVLSERVERELKQIETVYLPKVELGPTLQGLLDDVSRNCQDAVAARDTDSLESAKEAKDLFLQHVADARKAIGGAKADALESAMRDYHQSADDLSRRLIAEEIGEPIVHAMSSMQSRQKRVSALLDVATGFERNELGDAFARVAAAQRASYRIRIVVIGTSLSVVALLSMWLGSGVLRSLRDLTAGLERFGKGQLDVPITVTSADELGAVAVRANHMADALRRSVAELEAFNYSVSHDLRAPLRPLDGFSQALLEDYSEVLDPKAKDYLKRIRAAAQRMSQLIEDMIQLSRMGRAEIVNRQFDLALIGAEVVAELRRNEPARVVEFVSVPEAKTLGDSRLIRIVLENLLRNAWKFSRKSEHARIELGAKSDATGSTVFFVRDNGAGFDPTYANKLFQPFQRLHSSAEFEGTGIGLAIVQRIIHRHQGRVWAESTPGLGATFFFTLHDGKAPT